jgi:putative ABC transport system permease protein
MDFLANYFGSLNPMSFLSALPGNIAQGIIWGLMGLGVFLTFKLLNFADLSVDGSFATGGAVTAVMLINGCPVWATIIVAILAGLAAGLDFFTRFSESPTFSQVSSHRLLFIQLT